MINSVNEFALFQDCPRFRVLLGIDLTYKWKLFGMANGFNG